VAEAALEQRGRMRVSDPSGLGSREVDVFNVPTLEIGSLRFATFEGEVSDRLPPNIDGILGLDLFAGLILTLDRRMGAFRLSRGSLPAADGRTCFQSMSGPTIRLPLAIGGAVLEADIDTGQAVCPLLLPTEAATRVVDNGTATVTATARTVSQSMAVTTAPYSKPVTAGALALSVDRVGWPTPTPVSNLGWAAFRGRKLEIDRALGRVRLS
jgi:hypothetical protein